MLVPTGTGMRAAEGVGPYGDGETDCRGEPLPSAAGVTRR